jgi:hypothetical protein
MRISVLFRETELRDDNLCRPLLQSEGVIGGLPGICFCRSNLVK